ncbi:Eco57I restriction-modification methylase domain-containing protein [Pontimonas sp.]|nr:Eco57I restriction-modification methylase domain-containing protein [Pontimonas sp.]MDA9116905.1 Eco57I restriction-modification methylase domain-containing protein [Pontimonas sp.]
MLDPKLDLLQERLLVLESKKDMDSAKSAIRAVAGLLVPNADNLDFTLFRDGDGKLTANASWFFHDEEIADRRATYTLDVPGDHNLDIKVFGVVKPSMRTISWVVGLTPNFEDEPFNGVFNVGIDFIIPESKDKIIIALSKNYVIRTIELKGHLTATFFEIFANWTKIKDTSRKAEFHTMLWNSLDLHPINQRFYEGISQRFISLRQHLETSGVLDSHHSAQFANRLIGRIIFAWFLEKKSLLSKDGEYFASELFEDDTQYYRQKLESLFFEVLNTPVAERTVLDVLTPYLNGGLFEPKKEDLNKTGNLTFPRNYFDDLFQFLKGYNFTTDESTSDFQQVAIDPEMLGRIFENLLAEVSEETGDQARKAKGAFYTPREIVDFMCKESLKGYLRSKIPNDPNLDSRIYQLIDATERQFQDQDHNWRRDFRPFKDQIIDALDNLKVFDPACGSGAFPIGMMQLLVRIYARLEPRFDYHKAKLAIIEKNIYGADIEPMAVEISRLRAWLSLVVDEDKNLAAVKPLPNLDFKFVAANSLLELEKLTQLAFFEDENLDLKLQEIRSGYFSTESVKQKSKLKEKYLGLVEQELSLFGESDRTTQLKTFRPFESDSVAAFFDPIQMFGFDKFDIVIGNPPYVRQEKVRYKNMLKGYQVYNSTADLFTYFFERGINLLAEGGVLSLITSSKFGRAVYGERLREFLSSSTTIDYIIDHEGAQQFTAAVNTWILQTRNVPPIQGREVNVTLEESNQSLAVKQSDLGAKEWRFLNEADRSVLAKLTGGFPPLSEFDAAIYYGVKTGCTEAFLISHDLRDGLLQKSAKNSDLLFNVLRGRDIERYGHKKASGTILVTKNGIDVEQSYPDVAAYLLEVDSKLEGKVRARSDQGNHWMNLRDCKYYESLESEKIVWSEMAASGRFSRASADTYIIDTAYMLVTPHIEYLLAILNSKLVLAFMSQSASRLGGTGIRWKRHIVEQIPIPPIESIPTEKLERIKGLVLARENADDQALIGLDQEIDSLVFEIYGLSEEEISSIASMT